MCYIAWLNLLSHPNSGKDFTVVDIIDRTVFRFFYAQEPLVLAP